MQWKSKREEINKEKTDWSKEKRNLNQLKKE